MCVMYLQSMPIDSGFSNVKYEPTLKAGYETSSYNGSILFLNIVTSYKPNQVLCEIFGNVFKILKFTEEYAEILQEYISPEDYDKAMKEFHGRTQMFSRISLQDVSDEEIARRAKLILTITGEELGSDELADILNVDVFKVEGALKKYSAQSRI